MCFLAILIILVSCLLLAGLLLLPPHTAIVVVGLGLALLFAIGVLWASVRGLAASIRKIRAVASNWRINQ
jgi:hypothetical protein